MFTVFTDKRETFEANIELSGANLNETFCRIILETPEKNLLFNGHIDENGHVEVSIDKMKGILDDGVEGNMKLEIIAEDTYFMPWESEFVVDTSKKVQVEILSQETKPRISVSNVKTSNTRPKKITKKDSHVPLENALIREFRKQNVEISDILRRTPRAKKIMSEQLEFVKNSEKKVIIRNVINKMK